MSMETKIIEALELFDGKKITPEKCRGICADLGSALRDNELGKTQISVAYYIFGMCNEKLGNAWGAARAFKKFTALNGSKRQMKYARTFIAKFIDITLKEINWHKNEANRLYYKIIRI